jgi:hypothetical protein
MPTLRITIKMDNAAFAENEGPEVAYILRKLCFDIDDRAILDDYKTVLHDFNGNTVGEAKVTR